jgi:hypothetical protein
MTANVELIDPAKIHPNPDNPRLIFRRKELEELEESIAAQGILVPPIDLSLNIALPPLDRHRQRTKRALVKAYARFGRSDWKGGFEEACTIVETSARRYLSTSGTVQVLGKSGAPKKVAPNQINRMPLGALAEVFCGKLHQNQVDALLCSGLRKINPDRINVAHGKLSNAAEKRLRRNINKHMWTIDNLLRKIPP